MEESKWWKEEEEGVSSYFMTLRKRKDTGNGKEKRQVVLCEELSMEEATSLSCVKQTAE